MVPRSFDADTARAEYSTTARSSAAGAEAAAPYEPLSSEQPHRSAHKPSHEHSPSCAAEFEPPPGQAHAAEPAGHSSAQGAGFSAAPDSFGADARAEYTVPRAAEYTTEHERDELAEADPLARAKALLAGGGGGGGGSPESPRGGMVFEPLSSELGYLEPRCV